MYTCVFTPAHSHKITLSQDIFKILIFVHYGQWDCWKTKRRKDQFLERFLSFLFLSLVATAVLDQWQHAKQRPGSVREGMKMTHAEYCS
jgi:hypothetical protein